MDSIKKLAVERFTAEFIKVSYAGGRAMATFITLLDDYGLLSHYFPELDQSKHFTHHWEHHPEGGLMSTNNQWTSGDDLVIKEIDVKEFKRNPSMYRIVENGTVFDHVISCLNSVPDDSTGMEVVAVMFHDIGKPYTAKLHKSSTPELQSFSYVGHESVGVHMFEKMAQRLKFSNSYKKIVGFCIKEHLNYFRIPDMKPSKSINLILSPYFKILETVAYCDDKSRGESVSPKHSISKIAEVCKTIREKHVASEEFNKRIGERINGNRVMELRPDIEGREIGIVISQVRDWIIDNGLTPSYDDITKKIMEIELC